MLGYIVQEATNDPIRVTLYWDWEPDASIVFLVVLIVFICVSMLMNFILGRPRVLMRGDAFSGLVIAGIYAYTTWFEMWWAFCLIILATFTVSDLFFKEENHGRN